MMNERQYSQRDSPSKRVPADVNKFLLHLLWNTLPQHSFCTSNCSKYNTEYNYNLSYFHSIIYFKLI